jgi:hypothetical protein
MKYRFLYILPLAVIFLLPILTAADLPYNAQLTLEGYTISSPNILIGRFSKSESHGTYYIGHFQVKDVLAGSKVPETTLKLNSRTTTWMRFTDSDDILVFYPDSTQKSKLPAIGRKSPTLQKIRTYQKEQKQRPFGSLEAIGIRLESPETEKDDLVFPYTVKNFSRQTWRVNLDRQVRSNHHRAVSVLVYESNTTTSSSLRAPTLIYESERPWIGKSIIATGREGSRPDSHAVGASVKLKSGDSANGTVILRSGKSEHVYQVLINGHPDRGKSKVRLDSEKSIFIVLKIHDDYHYYSGNGRNQPSNTWYGTVKSNPVKVFDAQD